MLEGCNDARTGMPFGIPKGAMCVQRFDDSRNSAIHITYRISLRSSSMPEPRDPLLKVLIIMFTRTTLITGFIWAFGGRRSVNSPEQARGSPKQHWYVDTDEELRPVRPRLSVMILPQVPWLQGPLGLWTGHNLTDNGHRRLICGPGSNCWLLVVRGSRRAFSALKRCCPRQ